MESDFVFHETNQSLSIFDATQCRMCSFPAVIRKGNHVNFRFLQFSIRMRGNTKKLSELTNLKEYPSNTEPRNFCLDAPILSSRKVESQNFFFDQQCSNIDPLFFGKPKTTHCYDIKSIQREYFAGTQRKEPHSSTIRNQNIITNIKRVYLCMSML